MSELEPAVLEFALHSQSDPERAASGADRFRAGAAVMERALEGREFLVEERLTVADIVTGAVLAGATRRKLLPADGLPRWHFRRVPGTRRRGIASELANSIAAPIPWTARAPSSSAMLPASAKASDAIVNRPIPISKISRRPNRSDSDPALSTTLASVSVYASMTHCTPESPECRSCAIRGSAVFTTAMSSISIAVARQTSASVRCLLGTFVASLIPDAEFA